MIIQSKIGSVVDAGVNADFDEVASKANLEADKFERDLVNVQIEISHKGTAKCKSINKIILRISFQSMSILWILAINTSIRLLFVSYCPFGIVAFLIRKTDF